MIKVNLSEKFSLLSDFWQPDIIAELNDQNVKLVKMFGEFLWHHHENEDELFLVIKGQLKMAFRDKIVVVNEDEFIVVPKGVEHKPVAEDEAWILLFEPKSTKRKGNLEEVSDSNALEKEPA
ncbi:MAG: cupin domain-containing protein [Bacteroidota bacterium]|nr:cupin domain-containing protein [Bacteroidota bacterium]